MITLDIMPPLMFAGLVLFMLFGFPVAFSLMAVGLFFGFISIEMGFFTLEFLQAIPQRIFGSVIANELLLAIPFFTFMGAVLERSRLAEDMLDSMGQLFGRMRGGLGYSVILVSFVLGAITGTVAAQVIAMAMISLPVMMRYGYNMRYTTGVLAASGTIAQIVPPSLVLIILADQLKTPTASADVGTMYLAAWIPAALQISLFLLYTFFLTRIRPDWLPGIPEDKIELKGAALWKKALRGIIPTAVLIFLVLGTIMLGIATPTESGAMGAMGAVLLAFLRRQQLGGTAEWASLIKQAYKNTARITSMVVFILIGATTFSVVFQGVDGGHWVESLFSDLPGGWVSFLIIVNLFIFFLAFFLDFFEIVFILVPLLAPVAQKILTPELEAMGFSGADAATAALVWFGITLSINIQTSFMHPPFGFALFYLRGVAPKEVKSSDIYWGAVPWVVLQMIMTVIVMFSPGLVTALLDKGHAQVQQGQELNFTIENGKPATSPGSGDIPFQLDGQAPAKPQEPAKSPSGEIQFQLDK
ncbi:MAG TPA: TRAP transporter large permease subunit [Candidatus Thiothrix moscowensis]|uniref:TRAP transporter large permease n=1 Tax=unclassified Thiothrix TaxID=2636184 RepID=UPI0025CDE7D4|nr:MULTISPECIES: TRAP transporter large permease subunit [unclassified Thiothrix]HRJ53253.1 TRAP transporter large permease subunit [Candidatus Thiothrix moscowensis]HRJ93177.1 TRAP transporter large permease subunit [Candidatus Thiothrix moscowensis]